jgi:hypothetical protein
MSIITNVQVKEAARVFIHEAPGVVEHLRDEAAYTADRARGYTILRDAAAAERAAATSSLYTALAQLLEVEIGRTDDVVRPWMEQALLRFLSTAAWLRSATPEDTP